MNLTPDEQNAPLPSAQEPSMDDILSSIGRVVPAVSPRPTQICTCIECGILHSRIIGLEAEIAALKDLVRSLRKHEPA
jgi:hypothetical protein